MTATFMTLNATLVVELVVFIIVLAVLARFVSSLSDEDEQALRRMLGPDGTG